MRRPTRSSLKFHHLACPYDHSFPSPRLLNSRFVKKGAIMYALANIDFSNRFGVVVSELPDEIDDQDQTLDALEIAVFGAA